MKTTGSVLVQSAFGLYSEDPEKLQAYLSKRIDDLLVSKVRSVQDAELDEILRFVCTMCNVDSENLRKKNLGKIRPRVGREIWEARAIAYTILSSDALFGWTQQKIGLYFSGRHHSSIKNGLDNFKDWYDVDKLFRLRADQSIIFANKTLSKLS
jgi:chromosomal replication initiation ATPase DnaA